MKYNLLTCKGFDGNYGWFNFGDCMKAKLGAVFLIFLFAILNKWAFGIMGIAFNTWTAVAGSIVAYVAIISLTGALKVAFGVALVAGIITGVLGGATLGSTTEDGE